MNYSLHECRCSKRADLSWELSYTCLWVRLNDQLYGNITSLEFVQESKHEFRIDTKRIIIRHRVSMWIVTLSGSGVSSPRNDLSGRAGNRESPTGGCIKGASTCASLSVYDRKSFCHARGRPISIDAIENLWSNFGAIALFGRRNPFSVLEAIQVRARCCSCLRV